MYMTASDIHTTGITARASGTGLLDEDDETYLRYYLIAYWVEATVFGVYWFLYMVAMAIIYKRRAQSQSTPLISIAGNTFLFSLAGLHNGVNVYRLLKIYGSPSGATTSTAVAVSYLRSYKYWDVYIHAILLHFTTWAGDSFIMYRCWILWNRSYKIMLLPIAILMASLGTGITSIYWFQHQDKIDPLVMRYIFRTTIILNLVGNTLTTGLIAYRIWRQHRRSRTAGVHSSSGVDLFTLMRIIIESASIYTLAQLLIIILFFGGHPAVLIVQHASIPVTGIVFVLIVIRAYGAGRAPGGGRMTSKFEFPTRLRTSHELGEGETTDNAQEGTSSSRTLDTS